MSKQDILRKLTSRKFWLALIAFVTALLIVFKVDDGSVEQITALIMSFGSLISYILAEGIADSSNNNSEADNE